MQMEGNQQQSFRRFGDQLRLHTSSFANLSINDSIWSTSFATKRSDERRNFDVRVGGEIVVSSKQQKSSDFVGFNESWNVLGDSPAPHKILDVNGGYNKGVYSKLSNLGQSIGVNQKISKNVGGRLNDDHGGKESRKNNNSNTKNNIDNSSKNSTDKRFKTLPPSESLPRNERIGGYIFVCNNDTMEENLKRKLFGLPPRYRDSVRAITPGLPLFLYNYSTHQLHGVFEAASFGGTNMDMLAWEDKKCPGESRFPAQVRVVTRNICEPLEEDSFRPILHHYDGPKFRLELNVAEALSLLDIFAENKG